MLTIGKDWVLENINPQIEIKIIRAELNPQTYSICKIDLLISGEPRTTSGSAPPWAKTGSRAEKFDYMITNPPFGVSLEKAKKSS